MNTTALSKKLADKGAAITPSSFEEDVRQWFKVNGKKMSTLAGSDTEAKKLVVAAVNSVSRVPKLMECSFDTFATCLLTSATLRLYPGVMEECAYVPLNNGKTQRLEANWWPMYQGLIKLAYNSGFVHDVNGAVVWEADDFDYEEGDKPRLMHKPFIGPQNERGNRIGVYSIIWLASGRPHRKFLSAETIESTRSRSPGSRMSDSPWNSKSPDIVDSMWLKTALKRGLKLVPRSTELSQALHLDDAIDITEKPEQIDMSRLVNDIEGHQVKPEVKSLEAPRQEMSTGEVEFTEEMLGGVNV